MAGNQPCTRESSPEKALKGSRLLQATSEIGTEDELEVARLPLGELIQWNELSFTIYAVMIICR
jgi:hypothetical protein